MRDVAHIPPSTRFAWCFVDEALAVEVACTAHGLPPTAFGEGDPTSGRRRIAHWIVAYARDTQESAVVSDGVIRDLLLAMIQHDAFAAVIAADNAGAMAWEILALIRLLLGPDALPSVRR